MTGRAAVRTGQQLGGFATRVATVGIETALRELDLGGLIGRPADDVLDALVDRLAGPGSTMDDHLARRALVALRENLLEGVRTVEDLERVIRGAVAESDIGGLLVRFYGHYLYERFDRDFYERWVERVGALRARSRMSEIRLTIFEALRARVAGRDPTGIAWNGTEGRRLAEEILDETFRVFEAVR